jgi:hypothetical protein
MKLVGTVLTDHGDHVVNGVIVQIAGDGKHTVQLGDASRGLLHLCPGASLHLHPAVSAMDGDGKGILDHGKVGIQGAVKTGKKIDGKFFNDLFVHKNLSKNR